MAVVTQYVVERNGVARMTFTSKQQADAYDKMLDLAEQLEVLLGHSNLLEQQQLEDLALYLAQQKEDLLLLMQGKAKTVKKANTADNQLPETSATDAKSSDESMTTNTEQQAERLALVSSAA